MHSHKHAPLPSVSLPVSRWIPQHRRAQGRFYWERSNLEGQDQQEEKRKALLLPPTPSSSMERDGGAQVICYFAFFIGQLLKKSCQDWDRQLPRTWIAQDPWGVIISPVGHESWGKPSVPPHAEWMGVRYSLTWVIVQGHLQTVLLIAQQLSGGRQGCWSSQA